jgi:hypothetical protein
VPELSGVVYSTNVVFDQNIPPPSESYHQELRAVVVQEGPRMRLADVEAQILNKTFKDDEDGLLYDVKGVRTLKDRTMVADIALHGSTKKLRTPIHVADIIRMIQAMDGVTPSTGPLHRAIQERDNGTHESALYLESLSQPQHLFGVIPASVDDLPTMTEIGRSPYGDLSLASDEVACEGSRHDKRSPYGESSLLPDIEHDCSRMSVSELRQTRQYLEHGSVYSHLQDNAVKTCLEHCSTLNYTERDSVRKCLVAHEVLDDEENTPLIAGSATSNDTCLFVGDPIDAWVQNDPTRGADRHTPFTHPIFVEDPADPEHTPEVVGLLNQGLNKLAESLTWENWALKSGHYPSTSENLPPPEANTLEEAEDDDGELPQGSLKDLHERLCLGCLMGSEEIF